MKRLLILLVFFAAPAALAQIAGLGKGEERPGLYELTARSDLVVSVKVVSGSQKLAQVSVEEVFRGQAAPGQRLQIAVRDFNFSLSKQEKIVFADGETEILFLVPELNSVGKPKGDNRYTLFRGRFGYFTLPREGAGIYLEAVREFAQLTELRDHRELFSRLKGLLHSPNPLLVDAGLKEVLKLDLMEPGMVPTVMGFYEDPAPSRRIAALKLMGGLFSDMKGKEKPADLQESALPPLIAVARNDPEEEVRVAAVEALGAWGGPAVAETLKEIAKLDAAQAVRYRAEVILLKEGAERSPSSGGEKGP